MARLTGTVAKWLEVWAFDPMAPGSSSSPSSSSSVFPSGDGGLRGRAEGGVGWLVEERITTLVRFLRVRPFSHRGGGHTPTFDNSTGDVVWKNAGEWACQAEKKY